MAIENVNTIDEHKSKLVIKIVFDCHLSPDWRQMAIEHTVLAIFDPSTTIVIKNVFVYRIAGVLIKQSLNIRNFLKQNACICLVMLF